MRVLLDNCVVVAAKRLFVSHDVRHTRQLGHRGRHLSNGTLLVEAAALGFDVLVTTDKNIRSQHRLDALPLPVVELNTHFTRLTDLATLAPFFDAALAATADFRFVSIGPDGTLERLAPRASPEESSGVTPASG